MQRCAHAGSCKGEGKAKAQVKRALANANAKAKAKGEGTHRLTSHSLSGQRASALD